MAILGIYVILAGQPILSLLVSLDFRPAVFHPCQRRKYSPSREMNHEPFPHEVKKLYEKTTLKKLLVPDDVSTKNKNAKWFNPWPLYLVGGHFNQPFQKVTWTHHPKGGSLWITLAQRDFRLPWSNFYPLSLLRSLLFLSILGKCSYLVGGFNPSEKY